MPRGTIKSSKTFLRCAPSLNEIREQFNSVRCHIEVKEQVDELVRAGTLIHDMDDLWQLVRPIGDQMVTVYHRSNN